MPSSRDPFDLRRAGEDVLLDALRAGHPLALAEAYHRSVPAGHAVARRLVAGAEGVEELLLAVYSRLWTDPPAAGPLEGWVRRTTWTIGVEHLRTTGTAPASPSAAGLVPDLPAPEVRFLDAAERAIAELPDEQRRALLLAHDKGVPSAGQEPGAEAALTLALLALAGPETSGTDRDAMEADDCRDLSGLGDWCLGVATGREQAEVEQAIEERPGCAAVSRAVRRGRRRVEGLPATPDMGQRILVSVLTTSGRAAAPSPQPAGQDRPEEGRADERAAAEEPEVIRTVPAAAALGADLDGAEATEDVEPAGPDAAGVAPGMDPTGPLPPVTDGGAGDAGAEPEVAAPTDAADPFAAPEDLFAAPADPFAAPDDPVADRGVDPVVAEADLFAEDDPFAEADRASTSGDAVGDTADLDRAEEPEGDWRPDPGSTAELRLSDILAEGEDDDPFAGLDDAEEPPAARPGDPYAALRDVEHGDEPAPPAAGPIVTTGPVGAVEDDAQLVGGYVEGQEHHEHHRADMADARTPGRMAAVLAWILPIVGGSALGVLVAILVFGPPS